MIAAFVIVGVLVGFAILAIWAFVERNERQLAERRAKSAESLLDVHRANGFVPGSLSDDRRNFRAIADGFAKKFRIIEQLEDLERRRTNELYAELALYATTEHDDPYNVGDVAQRVRQLTDAQRTLNGFRESLHILTDRIERAVQDVPHDQEVSLIDRYHKGTLEEYLAQETSACL